MTNKDRHVLEFWYNKMSDVIAVKGREVTVGEVARHVGQSRVTAQKYLNRLVSEKAINSTDVVFKNGTTGKVYSHVE